MVPTLHEWCVKCFCAAGNTTDIRMLHISVEGAEIDILKSGLQLLSSGRVHAVLVDISPLHWTQSLDFVPTYQAAAAIDLLQMVTEMFSEAFILNNDGLPEGM